MIVYLGGTIQIHGLKISSQKELDYLKENIRKVLEEYLSPEFNSNVVLEWDEQAGKVDSDSPSNNQ